MLIFNFNIVRIFSVQMQVENGISTKRSMVETAIRFEDMEVRDLAFLDDRSLLVLHATEGKRPFTFYART